MMKHILKVMTQVVESMYKYFDSDLSESHRATLYICTLLDPRFKHYNWWPTRKYEWGLQHEWGSQKTFKSSAAAEDDVQEDDVEMTTSSADEDPFEKMCLSYESQVNASTVRRYDKSQALDQLEQWMKEKPIP